MNLIILLGVDLVDLIDYFMVKILIGGLDKSFTLGTKKGMSSPERILCQG